MFFVFVGMSIFWLQRNATQHRNDSSQRKEEYL